MTTNPNRDVRDDLLHAIDFNYASSLGYDSPEAFLAAYDTSRTAAVAPPADRAAESVCICGHTRAEHVLIGGPFGRGRLLCDTCDPDSTESLACKEFEAL